MSQNRKGTSKPAPKLPHDPWGAWGAYFLAKAILTGFGYLRPNFVWNIVFLAFLAIPLPSRFRKKKTALILRQALNIVLALLLLWRDSWLPSLTYLIEFFIESGFPSLEYNLNFIRKGLFNFPVLLLTALFYGYHRLSKNLYLAPVTIAAAAVLGFFAGNSAPKELIEAPLEDFFSAESRRGVVFDSSKLGKEVPDFDIILLHICSLSWDDLETAELSQHDFFRGADMVFTRYNSVTSHSTPSALRLMRSPCGQARHGDLYNTQDAPRDCFLFPQLRRAGFKTYTAYAHDGEFGSMTGFVRRFGKADEPFPTMDLPRYQTNFDGRALLEPIAVLRKWRQAREESKAPRAALYLNLVTLHGGAHITGEEGWWKKKRSEHYRFFFNKLAGDIEEFEKTLRASGRRAVIVFVPEHGLGLRATSVQRDDIREMPLPYITIVPTVVRLVGPGIPDTPAEQVIVRKPTSHLALAYLLGELMKRPAFSAPGSALLDIAAGLPEVDHVAENAEAIVIEKAGKVFLRGKNGSWRNLPEDVKATPGF